MTERPNDPLLLLGKLLALIIQGVCALVGGLLALLIPAILIYQGKITDGALDLSETVVAKFPFPGITLMGLIIVILAATFLFFGRIRAIIGTVGQGDPFIPENAQRLSVMAWLLLGVQVLAVPVGVLRLHLANLLDESGRGGETFDVSVYQLMGVLLVIVLFILARVFRKGAAMREDLEGTV